MAGTVSVAKAFPDRRRGGEGGSEGVWEGHNPRGRPKKRVGRSVRMTNHNKQWHDRMMPLEPRRPGLRTAPMDRWRRAPAFPTPYVLHRQARARAPRPPCPPGSDQWTDRSFPLVLFPTPTVSLSPAPCFGCLAWRRRVHCIALHCMWRRTDNPARAHAWPKGPRQRGLATQKSRRSFTPAAPSFSLYSIWL